MHYNEKRQFVLLVFCIPFESLFTIWNYDNVSIDMRHLKDVLIL